MKTIEYFYTEKREYVICTIADKYSQDLYLIKFLDNSTNKYITRAAFKKELRFRDIDDKNNL